MDEKAIPTKQTVIRVGIALVALINTIMTMCGMPQDFLQIDGSTIGTLYECVSALIAVGTTCWVGWKNNSFTAPAITADNVLRLLEQGADLIEAAKKVEEEDE